VRANPAGVQHAEKQARLLGAEINLGRFEWGIWVDNDSDSESGISCKQWIEKFEADYWNRKERNQQSQTTWNTDYRVILNKLPSDQSLSPELLLEIIGAIAPDSRQRKRAVQVCSALAKFAGFQTDFSNLVGSYSPRRVNPRFLPKDEAIAEIRQSITNEAWRWVVGVVACYGLRPHEAFHLNLSEFPIVEVDEETKTGRRIVYPLYPERAEAWQLDQVKLPNFQKGHSNAALGTKVADEFRDRQYCSVSRSSNHLSPLNSPILGDFEEVGSPRIRGWSA
jgi:hypothetical protein